MFDPLTFRPLRQVLIVTSLSLGTALVGCSTTPSSQSDTDESFSRDPNRLVITDCLLPGQVRQLGSRSSYLSPRRPIKTTISDCEIRGGEYVAFDRANYASALRVWLPRAQEGDAEAQVYVGEIYEKGLGVQADYPLAAQWYRRAAEQDNSRAAINLGYLYESGLGVPQDLTQAMNWYRAASGLDQAQLEYVSSVESAKRQQAKIDRVALERELESLRSQLAQHKQQLQSSRSDAAEQQRQVQGLQKALSKRSQAVAVQALQQAQLLGDEQSAQALGQQREKALALSRQLKSARAEQLRLSESVAAATLSGAELQQRLSASQEALATARAQLETQRTRLSILEKDLSLTADAEQSRSDLMARFAAAQAEVLRQQNAVARAELTATTREQLLQDKLAGLQGDLQQSQWQLAQQRSEVTRLGALLSREQLASQAQIEALSQERQRDQSTIATLQTQLDSGQREQRRLTEELMSLQLAALEVSDQQSLALGEQLQQSEAQLAEQQARIGELERQITESQAGLSSQQASDAVVTAQSVGPSIEIIEPPLTLTRSHPSLLVRSPVSAVEIIGRVDSAQELLTFNINGNQQNVDENGIFRAQWPVGDNEDQVTMVAVDRLGSRTALEFTMVPPSDRTAVVASGGNAQPAIAVDDIDFGTYHAVVIGNNAYRYMSNLRTATTDARAVAQLLEQDYGFNTTLLLDATRYDILSTLNTLRETLTERDNLLIYYAGHGELDRANQRGYWLPVDAEPDSSSNWISNVAITDILNVMNVRHVLAVVDSCYSLALTRNGVARLDGGWTDTQHRDWYKAMLQTRARTVLTSGGLKPVLDGGGGQHSVFAAAFLATLRDNREVLEGYKLFRAVQKRMKTATAALQVTQDPQYAPIKFAGHEAGEFFLLPNTLRQTQRTPLPRLAAR